MGNAYTLLQRVVAIKRFGLRGNVRNWSISLWPKKVNFCFLKGIVSMVALDVVMVLKIWSMSNS